jgi:integrase
MGELRRPHYTATDPKTGKKVRRQSKVWWIRYYRNGKRHEESSHSKKKGDAALLLKLREGDIAKGVPVTAKVGKLRFDEAVADVVTDYRVNGKRTLSKVEGIITNHLEPFFGGRRMAAITTAGIRSYVASRQAPVMRDDGTEKPGAASASINRELALLKRAFRLAQQDGKLLHAPHIPMLQEHNVRQGFFEREEFEDVRAALPQALHGVATVAYLTGWRVPSEVFPLKWAQVDRKARTIRLEPGTTKNAEARTVPYGLLPEFVDVIEQQWASHKRLQADGVLCPYVFNRHGNRIKDIRKAWQTACKTAGVPGKIPHDFRRTAVRNLSRAGVPDAIAMQITGHKTRSVYDRYNIVNEADLRDGLSRLASEKGKEKGKSAQSGRVTQIR